MKIAIIGIGVSVLALAMAAQNKPAPAPQPKPLDAAERSRAGRPGAGISSVPYPITEVESLKLQVAQKNTILAQIQYQQAVGQFNSEIKAVHDAHKWPDSVTFNGNTLTFSGPPDTAPDMTKPTGPPVEPAASDGEPVTPKGK